MKHRPQWGLLGLGALIVLGLFTYPTWRKFISLRGGGADFANATDAQRDVFAKIRKDSGLSAAQTAYAAMLTVIPAPTSVTATPNVSQLEPIKSGDFVTLDALHMAKGKATLFRLSDNSLILRFDDFTVTNGPALNVYLCAAPAPKTTLDLNTNGYQLLLGPLQGSIGSQTYARIPSSLPLARYKSVVIYSEDLKTIYSSAPLN